MLLNIVCGTASESKETPAMTILALEIIYLSKALKGIFCGVPRFYWTLSPIHTEITASDNQR